MSEKKETIECPGSFLKGENWMFEQTEQGYIFWDKVANKPCETPPSHNYVPLQECPWKLASTIEDYEETNLWQEVRNFIVDHVFLPDDRLYDVLTAWVFACWLPEVWDVIPYLLIKGPISSGKTRLLETLEAISYRGIFSANMTSAALFRVLELHRPTIFLDETEIYNKEEYSDVTHLLNAGYRRGQKAWRVEHGKDGLLYIKGYDVFGFKALSGTEELAQALQSRSIVIDMVKNIQRVNFRVNERRAKTLRNRLLLWRFHQLSQDSSLGEDVKQSEPSEGVYPPQLEQLAHLGDGRLMELFYCLLTVANEGTENIIEYAKTMYEIRASEQQATVQCQILEAMLKCNPDIEGVVLTKTVADKLNDGLDDKDKFKTRYVSKILASLGLNRVHTRLGNGFKYDKRMLQYRVRQYGLQGYALSEPSLSFTPSPDSKTSLFSSQKPDLVEFKREGKVLVDAESSHESSQLTCWICHSGIFDGIYEKTPEGPAHVNCYQQLKEGLKQNESLGSV